MKRILATTLILGMMLCVAGCGDKTGTETTGADSTTSAVVDTTAPVNSANAVNEGVLAMGSYTGSSVYAQDDFKMEWNYIITFDRSGRFIITDKEGTEKGSGTYAFADDHYTMTYSDDRACTFVVNKDGSLTMTSDLPYGKATISNDTVGGISVDYVGEAVDEAAIAAGTYNASYTKESAMAGTVVYEYVATVGEDGTFSYSVSFDMRGTAYDGASASGTYKVDGDKFIFTDSEGNVTEGKITAEKAIVISLKASAMASTPYEVTFVLAK